MFTILEENQFLIKHDGYIQGIFRGQEPFYPSIGKNVIEVQVDLTWRSKLRFDTIIPPSEGLILWQLHLGLEESMLELTDEGQFLAQVKAIQEFTKQLYEPFKTRTFGLSLYKGPLDFSKIVRAPEERIARRDYIVEFLKLLSAYLPESPLLFLMLDGPMFSEGEFLALTNKEQFFPFHLIIRHPLLAKMPHSTDAIGWGFSTVMGEAYAGELEKPTSKRIHGAFLMPHSSCPLSIWKEWGIHIQRDYEARFIPEELLTEMWEGVDQLYVFERGISTQGRRKVAGFEAAGGIIEFI
jgi:hypothetical protein